MQIISFEKNVTAEYRDYGGRESVILTGEMLKFDDVYGGPTLVALDPRVHPPEMTGRGAFEETMFDQRPIRYTRSSADGKQRLEILIPDPPPRTGSWSSAPGG